MTSRSFGEPITTFGQTGYTFGATEKAIYPSSINGSEKNKGLRLVVKLYTNQWSTQPYAQEIVYDSITINKDLYSFDIAEIGLPNIDGLSEDNKIEIYEANRTGSDIKVFSGYIYEIKPIWKQFSRINITARSEKAIMGKRLMLAPIKFYDAKRKVSSIPDYPASWGLGETILTGNSIYTNTGLTVPESGTPSYTYQGYTLVDTSYVYVSDDNELWKYETSLVSLGNTTGVPTKDYIEEMLEPYNTSYGDNRTVDTDLNTNLRTNRVIGDSMYDILDELAMEADATWDIQDGVIRFKTLLGIDRTTGSEYQEINFDGKSPQDSNIKKIDLLGQATKTTILAYRDQTGIMKINTDNYVDFVYGTKQQDFRSGNTDQKVSNYLQLGLKAQRTYNVEVEQNSIVADTGDKLKIIVNNTNNYFDIDTDVIVTTKTIKYNKGKNETFGIQEFKIQQINQKNWAKDIVKNIKLLQLK